MALHALHTLVTEFTSCHLHTVDAVTGFVASVAIQQILAQVRPSTQIAIAAVTHVVVVRTVFRHLDAQGWERNVVEKLRKLFEEGTLWVIVPPVLQRIEVVAVPDVFVTDLERGIRRMHRDDLLAGDVTCSFVEFAFIAKTHTPLLPTRRTLRRRREVVAHACNLGGKFLEECEICLRDLETCGARWARRHMIMILSFSVEEYAKISENMDTPP